MSITEENVCLWNKSFMQTEMNRIIAIPNMSNSLIHPTICIMNHITFPKKRKNRKMSHVRMNIKTRKNPILYFKIIALSRKLHSWKMLPCEMKVRSPCFQLQWPIFSWIQTCMHWEWPMEILALFYFFPKHWVLSVDGYYYSLAWLSLKRLKIFFLLKIISQLSAVVAHSGKRAM